MASSMGFRASVSLRSATQATGRLALAPAGLPPAEHVYLVWTHAGACSPTSAGAGCASLVDPEIPGDRATSGRNSEIARAFGATYHATVIEAAAMASSLSEGRDRLLVQLEIDPGDGQG